MATSMKVWLIQARGIPPPKIPRRRRFFVMIRNLNSGDIFKTISAEDQENPQWDSQISLLLDPSDSIELELHDLSAPSGDLAIATRIFTFKEMESGKGLRVWYEFSPISPYTQRPPINVLVEMSFDFGSKTETTSEECTIGEDAAMIYVPTFWNGMAYLTPMEVDIIDQKHLKLKSATIPDTMPFIESKSFCICGRYAKLTDDSYTPIERMIASRGRKTADVEKIRSPPLKEAEDKPQE